MKSELRNDPVDVLINVKIWVTIYQLGQINYQTLTKITLCYLKRQTCGVFLSKNNYTFFDIFIFYPLLFSFSTSFWVYNQLTFLPMIQNPCLL
jgi:hypothetical protein